MDELKPCPFCGSAAKLYPSIRGYRAFVECTNTDCQTSSPPEWADDSNAGAIEVWNRRATDPNPGQ